MEVSWVQAVQVGVIGFSTVFFVLVILAVVIWLTGLVVNRASAGKNKTDKTEKEA